MTEFLFVTILAATCGLCSGILIARFIKCIYVNKSTIHIVNCWAISGSVLLSYYGGYVFAVIMLVIGVFEGVMLTKAIQIKKNLEDQINKNMS